MKMKLIKFLSASVAVILMTTGIMTGCGGDQKGPAETTKADSTITSNEGSLPLTAQKVTLTAIARRDPVNKPHDELTMFKKLEELTNVHIEWEMAPITGWPEKKNLMIASREMPDIIFGKGIEDGDLLNNLPIFLAMDQYIEKYGVNIKKFFTQTPGTKEISIAPDGHIYSLPQYLPHMTESTYAMIINKNWLDNLGLKVPVTLEDYRQVLKAFADKDANGNGDPKDEIPLTAQWWNFDWVFPSFGMAGEQGVNFFLEDGKVKYRPIEERYKKAVSYLHTLYKDGSIDPESFTQTLNQYQAKVKNQGKEIIGSFLSFTVDSIIDSERAKHHIVLPPFEGEYGKKWAGSPYYKMKRNTVFVSSATKNPDLVMRWIDQLYTEDMAVQLYYGTMGEDVEKTNDGKYNILPPRDPNLNYDKSKWMYAPADFAPIGVTPDLEKRIIPTPVQKDKIAINDIYKPYLSKENLPPYFLTLEQTEQARVINADIGQLIGKNFSKWIINGGIENEWDSYISQLKKLGVDKLIALHQKAYDDFKAKSK